MNNVKQFYKENILKEKETFAKFSEYLYKKSSYINDRAKFWRKSSTEYQVEPKEEYFAFLKKSKIKPDGLFDEKIIKKINQKLDKTFKEETPYKKSLAALLEVVIKCHNEVINKIDNQIMGYSNKKTL